MPDRTGTERLPHEQISLDPLHTGWIGETTSSLVEGNGGEVQDGHVTMAPLQQVASAGVDRTANRAC